VRVTTAFKRLLRLDGVNVTSVVFGVNAIVVVVALRRRRLICPHCGHTTSARYDTRPCPSTWRHLDLGVWRVELRSTLRRLRCPTHGVVVEAVPFARPGAHLTRDFDDLLAWLATRMDKTAIARLCRVSWRTVRAGLRTRRRQRVDAPTGSTPPMPPSHSSCSAPAPSTSPCPTNTNPPRPQPDPHHRQESPKTAEGPTSFGGALGPYQTW
jgi:transposase